MSDETLYVYDTDTVSLHGRATATDSNVSFPEDVDGWPDVMDCRAEPYTDKSIDENCDLARHVRKPFILVTEDQHDELASDSNGDGDGD
jgi:hypothetical protein